MTYADGLTRLWNLEKRGVMLAFRVWWPFQTINFSPDSNQMVTAEENGRITIYDLASGSVIRTHETGFSEPWAKFSPDGGMLGVFSAQSQEVFVMEVASGRVIHRLLHPDVVRGLAWHPQGQAIATGCADMNGYLWKLDHRERPIRTFSRHQASLTEVAFHSSGNWLSSGSWDGTTRLWDIVSGQEMARLTAGGGNMTFSRDGSQLAFYPSTNEKTYSAQVCEIAARCALRFLRPPHPDPAETDPGIFKEAAHWQVDFSRDERILVSAGKHGVRVWDLELGAEVTQLTRLPTFSAFFHPDGQHLIASGNGGVLSWRLLHDGTGVRFSEPERLAAQSQCERAAISKRGTVLAYGHAGRIHLQGSEQSWAGWPASQWVAVSPDGGCIAASAWHPRGTVRLWNTATGDLLKELPVNGAADVVFSPDSRWLVTGGPREYSFLNLATLEVQRRLPRLETPTFHGVIAFSPDGGLMAVSRSLTKVQLLDSKTLEEVARLESPIPQLVSWLAFSPSGRQLAVATETPFIQIWDLAWLRKELAKVGLDWGADPPQLGRADSHSQAAGIMPSKARDHQPGPFLILTCGAVILATCLGVFVLRRNKLLVGSYQRLDELAMQRRRDLELAHRELLHSEKMKALGTLAAGIAHDFNNLLSVVRLSNDVIGQSAGNHPSVREEVESIENAVQQGRAVVRSMLGYSREAADKPCSYAAGDVLADSVGLLSKQFLSGIVLTMDVDRAAPQVWGAPSRLEQILLNLIVNAAEAMKGRGRLFLAVRSKVLLAGENITLRPQPAGRYVEVSVADSGPGIAPETLPRIFEPFFTTKTVGTSPGTGLGLSTVFTIAREDGFGLAVETAVGKGTTFRILIPGEGGPHSPIADQSSEIQTVAFRT